MKRRTPTVRESVEVMAKALGGTVAHVHDAMHQLAPWDSDSERDWKEGNYQCVCGSCNLGFIGHKLALNCRACHEKFINMGKP